MNCHFEIKRLGVKMKDDYVCLCRKCIEDNKITHWDGSSEGGKLLLSSSRTILCESCGNKRCPHANDHNNKCTKSNDPGQKGSVYE